MFKSLFMKYEKKSYKKEPDNYSLIFSVIIQIQ